MSMFGSQAHTVMEIHNRTRERIRQIVSEEHHALIKKYKMRPGKLTDELVVKILNRIDELTAQ